MNPSEIKEIIESSFLPYRCVAEIWDYKERIRFRIYDKDNNPIITISELEISNMTEQNLGTVILGCKEEIKGKGFQFN